MTANKISRLAQVTAGASKVPAVSSSKLRKIVSGRRGETLTHRTLGPIRIELPGALKWAELEAAAHKATVELGHKDDTLTYAAAYTVQLATRVLFESVRDPDDHSQPFATSMDEWGELDNDVLNSAWLMFNDVRERLDPVSLPLDPEETIAVAAAVKKKDARYLRTFGVEKLSLWLASMGDRLVTSPPPSSPSSDSDSDPTTPTDSASPPEEDATPVA